MNKKLIVPVLTLVFVLVFGTAMSAFAAQALSLSGKMSVSTNPVAPGENTTMTLSLQNNSGMQVKNVQVKFNADAKLEAVDEAMLEQQIAKMEAGEKKDVTVTFTYDKANAAAVAPATGDNGNAAIIITVVLTVAALAVFLMARFMSRKSAQTLLMVMLVITVIAGSVFAASTVKADTPSIAPSPLPFAGNKDNESIMINDIQGGTHMVYVTVTWEDTLLD